MDTSSRAVLRKAIQKAIYPAGRVFLAGLICGCLGLPALAQQPQFRKPNILRSPERVPNSRSAGPVLHASHNSMRSDGQVRQAQMVEPLVIEHRAEPLDPQEMEDSVVYEDGGYAEGPGPHNYSDPTWIDDGWHGDYYGSSGCASCGGGCGDSCCDTSGCSTCGCSSCCFRNACGCRTDCGIWGGIEAIWWWQRDRPMPALATTSPVGTPIASAGVLGLSTTEILFGGDSPSPQERPGGRIELGFWLDDCHCFGLGGRFFGIDNAKIDYFAASDGSTILAQPFINTTTGLQDAQVVGFPANGIFGATGSVGVHSTSEIVGGDFYLRAICCRDCSWGIDYIAGYQYSRVNESLIVRSDATITSGVNTGLNQTQQDIFDAKNQFHGLMIGMKGYDCHEWWSIHWTAKVGLGSMQQSCTVNGNTTVISPGAAASMFDSGLYTSAANIGDHSRSEFAVVPEFNVRLEYQASKLITLSAGYSFIYWSNVLLPGDQINTGNAEFTFVDNDYFAHGLSLGLHMGY